MPTIWSSSLISILLLNANPLSWQWITPPQYTARLVTATYTMLGWRFYCSRSQQSCYTQLSCPPLPVNKSYPTSPRCSPVIYDITLPTLVPSTANFLSCVTPGYAMNLFWKPLCFLRLLINFAVNWQIPAHHLRGETVNYKKIEKEGIEK